jgi:signal transduction histidine kinase
MPRSKIYAWGVVALSLATLAVTARFSDPKLPPLTTFIFWCILLAASELLPVTLGFDTSITMGFPTLLAASIIFPPPVAMAIAGLGSFDPREVRREIELHRAAFNRAQVMIAVGAASSIFHSGIGRFNPGTVALAATAHIAINLGLVATAVHVDQRIPFLQALRMIPPRPIPGFVLSTALLATLGTATAIAYTRLNGGGGWVVVAILIPLLFARMTIQGAKAQQELFERVRSQQEALLAASEKVFQEREKERARIAESIHDTSLQMLAAAAYGCSNTIELMNAGHPDRAKRTLSTTQDAVQNAIAGLREALVDLRRSAVEEGGLVETINKFTDELSTIWAARIEVEATLSQEPPTPVAMAAFQILQEGLVNALKHSQSERIIIEITEHDTMLKVIVRDEGVGFDLEKVVGPDHLGMSLMRERAEGVGGQVKLESVPGKGTRLEAMLPAGVSVA